MEFLVCMLLASILTGGRVASGIIHAVKGTTPPYLEKARLKAQQQPKPGRQRSSYASGKPRLADVAAVYWGDAMEDAIAAHDRRRVEKAAQRAENTAAKQEGRTPQTIRPGMKQRAKRLWNLLWQPVGESKTDSTNKPEGDIQMNENEAGATGSNGGDDLDAAKQDRDAAWAAGDADAELDAMDRIEKIERAQQHDGMVKAADAQTATHLKNEGAAERIAGAFDEARKTPAARQPGAAGGASGGSSAAGEVANYETAMAELDKLEEAQRNHLDTVQAALEDARRFKQRIADAQASYRPAADTAGNVHQSLEALHLDQETIANTGTIVDSMPPNAVDTMFDQIEAMEDRAQQQVTNAEAALAATAVARQVIVAKYGDAHATVQGELAGDSRFLAGTGAGV